MLGGGEARIHQVLSGNGYLKESRAGAFTSIPDGLDKHKWTLYQTSGATFLEAVYYCVEHHRSNQFVQHILATGVPGVVLLNPKIPADAIAYSRDQGNVCVGFGAPETFIELMRLVPTVEEAVKSSCRERGDAADDDSDEEQRKSKKKRSQAGEETRWWQIVQQHWPDKWGSWAEFDRCKIVTHKLQRLNILDKFFDYAERFGEFHQKDLCNKDVFKAMWTVGKEMDDENWADAIFELMKMTFPTSDDIGWVLRRAGDWPQPQNELRSRLRHTHTGTHTDDATNADTQT